MGDSLRICRTKKAGYPTEERALDVLATVRRSNMNRDLSGLDVPNKVYQCPYCMEWHMTHSSKEWVKKTPGSKNRGKPGNSWKKK